jgi:diacylglycerol O-acyltransferase
VELLSPLDAAFLDAEDSDRHASLAIASIAVMDGPPPSQEELVEVVGARMRSIPRARQKVRRVPLDLGPPVWVDDPHFDPSYHFRRTALPAPGDEAALHRLIARIMSQRLDRDRPLWESWAIEGLAGNRWAVLTKLHHCLADGVSGAQLHEVMFSGSPDVVPWPPTWVPEPEPEPGTVRLLLGALSGLARNPADQIGRLVAALRAPARVAHLVADTVKGFAALAGALRPAAPSSLSGPIGQQRRYGVARASLPNVVNVGESFGVTVNDVVLTAISGAFRTLLLHRGERPDAHTVRTLVPVSVRGHGEESILDNRFSLVVPFLPVDVAEPVEALAEVHTRLIEAKASGEAEAGRSVTSLAAHEPFGPVSWAIRLATRLPQRNIVTVTTNVPGPRTPLYVLGRKVVEILPVVPIALRLRIGVAMMSYCDNVVFGITADYDSAPEVDLLTIAIEQGIADLAAAARTRQPSPQQDSERA